MPTPGKKIARIDASGRMGGFARKQGVIKSDYVMIRVRPEQFPSGIVKKLNTRRTGPFKILKRVRSNAYVVDLPPDFGINSTFNVTDLVTFRDLTVIPNDPFEPSPPFE